MSGDQIPQLSLVIPAYNEERRLPASLVDVKTFFTKIAIPLEVLVMVETSSDRTLEKSREVFRAATCTSLDNITSDGHGGATHLLGESEALFDGKGSS